jgi:hypothetical protein
MTRGVSTTLPTQLPARFRQGFPWALDRRCKAVREVAADLVTLWQDLGGYDALSAQQLWLCERVVFIRQRVLAFESAALGGKDLPFEAGVYSNLANVLMGYLRTLGLERKARLMPNIRDYLAVASTSQAAA